MAQWSEGNSVALCSSLKGRMSYLPQVWGSWGGWHALSPHPTWLACLQQSKDVCSSTSQAPGPVYLGTLAYSLQVTDSLASSHTV